MHSMRVHARTRVRVCVHVCVCKRDKANIAATVLPCHGRVRPPSPFRIPLPQPTSPTLFLAVCCGGLCLRGFQAVLLSLGIWLPVSSRLVGDTPP